MVLDVHWDYRVLAFGFVITVITGVAFGLLVDALVEEASSRSLTQTDFARRS